MRSAKAISERPSTPAYQSVSLVRTESNIQTRHHTAASLEAPCQPDTVLTRAPIDFRRNSGPPELADWSIIVRRIEQLVMTFVIDILADTVAQRAAGNNV